MKSSVFQLVAFAWAGASVVRAHELLRAGGAGSTFDVQAQHAVRFDADNESADVDEYDCGLFDWACHKCRATCHLSTCVDGGAGVFGDGHDCRVKCRCAGGCQKLDDTCPADDLEAAVDEADAEGSIQAVAAPGLRSPRFDANSESADADVDEEGCGLTDWACHKCRTKCHLSTCIDGGAGVFGDGHDCRVKCRCAGGCQKLSDTCPADDLEAVADEAVEEADAEGSVQAVAAPGLRSPRFDADNESADADVDEEGCGLTDFACHMCRTKCHLSTCADGGAGLFGAGHECRVQCRCAGGCAKDKDQCPAAAE